MILDERGNPIRHPRLDGSCPKCGSDKKSAKPVLGGKMVCMKCGEEQSDTEIESSRGSDIPEIRTS